MNRDDWNERYRAVPLLWQVDPEPFLGNEVGAMPPGTVLDLGAGEGRNAVWLARRGWRVTAVDFSDVAIERGRALAQEAGVTEAIQFVTENVLDFYPRPGGYDLVLSMFVHLPADQRRTVLKRATAALAPGGVILVVGYDHPNATEGTSGVRDPALLFSAADICAELGGLRIERAEQLQVGDAFDTIVRAVRPVEPAD